MYHLGDKYQARKYVARKVGEKYLVPIYDYCTKWNELDFNKYPNSFVIKGTHSSGDVILCKNKNRLIAPPSQMFQFPTNGQKKIRPVLKI